MDFSSSEVLFRFRLPLSVINRLAERSIESYWTTRPFNKTPIKDIDENHRSKFSLGNAMDYSFSLQFPI